MKVAFLILAHHQPQLLARFVNHLSGYGDIFIHVDARVDITPFKTLIGHAATFIEERQSTKWGGYSLVEAYFCLVRAARKHSNYDYYSFHSGVDYPIKPLEAYLNFLACHQGENFFEAFPMPEDNLHRFKRYYFIDWVDDIKNIRSCRDRIITSAEKGLNRFLPARSMFKNWVPYKGSQWHTLTAQLVHHCVEFIDHTLEARLFFKLTACPDEHLIQTFAMHWGYQPHGNLRYIRWDPGASSPNRLIEDDMDVLKKTDAFFARKFDEQHPSILDRLDQWLSAQNNNS